MKLAAILLVFNLTHLKFKFNPPKEADFPLSLAKHLEKLFKIRQHALWGTKGITKCPMIGCAKSKESTKEVCSIINHSFNKIDLNLRSNGLKRFVTLFHDATKGSRQEAVAIICFVIK
jgi:hypothetical protein